MQVVGSLAIVFGRRANGHCCQTDESIPFNGQSKPIGAGSTNVGTREEVVLINAAGQQLLVVAAPGNVRTQRTCLTTSACDPVDEAKPADFSAVWQSVNPFGGTR